jgi:phage FluMu protein Com
MDTLKCSQCGELLNESNFKVDIDVPTTMTMNERGFICISHDGLSKIKSIGYKCPKCGFVGDYKQALLRGKQQPKQ